MCAHRRRESPRDLGSSSPPPQNEIHDPYNYGENAQHCDPVLLHDNRSSPSQDPFKFHCSSTDACTTSARTSQCLFVASVHGAAACQQRSLARVSARGLRFDRHTSRSRQVAPESRGTPCHRRGRPSFIFFPREKDE